MLLQRFTGSDQIVVGASVSHRDIPGTDTIVGCLCDLIPMRIDLSDDPSLRSVIERHRSLFVDDFGNARIGFDQLKSAVSGVVSSPESPLFSHLFGMISADPGMARGSLQPLPALIPRASVALDVLEEGDTWTACFEFDSQSVPEAVADSIAEGFLALATDAAAAPERSNGRLGLTRSGSLDQDQSRWQAPVSDPPPQALAEWLRSSLVRQGDKPLLLFEEQWTSARELLRRTAEFAGQLQASGVTPGSVVAICLPRGVELVATLLATIQSGGVFLLLDPDHPLERNRRILQDSSATLLAAYPGTDLATGQELRRWSPGSGNGSAHPTEWLLRPPGTPVYLIYSSGSTGEPKGVMAREEGLLMRLQWGLNSLPAETGEKTCLKTSPAFVDFVAELLQPLLAGLPVVIADPETGLTPELLAALIAKERITRLTLVPTILSALLDLHQQGEASLESLRLCISSGEPLSAELVKRFALTWPRARLINLYGSSEVSGDVTAQLPVLPSSPISIGWPLSGAGVWILDRSGQPVPQGAIGEIIVTGPFVALGYVGGDPSERFGDPEAPRFRTGDLGFWLADTGIVLLGREDGQVKIGGVRIDCGEVESAILDFPGLREACVVPVVRPGSRHGIRLWAYVAAPAPLDESALRSHLLARLPRSALPAGFTRLTALPVGPTGKRDRNALPPPGNEEETPSADVVAAPIATAHRWLADLWEDILGRPVERADADFFRIGGASMDAVRLSHRLAEMTGHAVPVSLLFVSPTLEAYAEALSKITSDNTATGPVRAIHTSIPNGLSSRDGNPNGPFPATPNQVWLWNLFQTDPSSPAFNLPVGYRIDGVVEPGHLDRALVMLLAHHPSLRTTLFADGGSVRQRIQPPPHSLLSVEHLPAQTPEALEERMVALARHPFDLERELPMRASLLVRSTRESVFLLVLHHAAVDGWSGQLLLRDLATILRGDTLPPSLLPPPLAVHAAWYAARRPSLQCLLPKYLEALEGARAPHPPGMAHQDRGQDVGVVSLVQSLAVTAEMLRSTRMEGATLFQVATTLWCVLMQRLTDLDRPLVGVVQSGRERPEVAEMVGFLANTTLIAPALRREGTLNEALKTTRAELLDALELQDIPLSWVQGAGHWPTGVAGSGLACIVLEQTLSQWTLDVAGFRATAMLPSTSPAARCDLALMLTHDGGNTQWTIEYAPSRVPVAVVQRLAEGLQQLIEAFARGSTCSLACLAMGPSDGLRSLFSAPPSAVPVASRMDDMLRQLVATQPEAILVIDVQRSMSAAELAGEVKTIGQALVKGGVAAGSSIGIALPPGGDQIALLLALWQIGATAVLLDPAWPELRQQRAMAVAGASLLISDISDLKPFARDGDSQPPCLDGHQPSATAAILFTSGTTGEPKGIALHHAALCRLGLALRELYRLTPTDRILQTVSPGFDVALSDLAMALATGAPLLPMPRSAVMPGRSLTDTLATYEVSVMQVTAAVLHATTAVPLPKLRLIAVGGEALSGAARHAWSAGRRLLSVYGPTEATVTVSAAELTDQSPAGLIGWPVAPSQLAVVDPNLEPVPPGFPGELLIGGPNLSSGYVGGMETASPFIEQPVGLNNSLPLSRWFRSGDRAVFLPGEGLVFLGRLDQQRKVRGIRFEPAGVEALLEGLPGVLEACVDLAAPDAGGTPMLCAWIRPDPEAATATLADEARAALRLQLPEALVPSRIIPLAAFPLTPNGKIDRSALPMPLAPASATPSESISGDDLQALVRCLWQELLQTNADLDNMTFYDAGGHSLLIVTLHQRLEERLTIRIPIAEFFAAPTITTMTNFLQELLRSEKVVENGDIEEFLL